MSPAELREHWVRVTAKVLPRISPNMLRLALAWELQAKVHGGLSLFDVFGARRDQQNVQHVRILLRGAHDLIVVTDFLHRKRNVLVGLHLDLAFEFVFAEALRHLDHFRDRCVA